MQTSYVVQRSITLSTVGFKLEAGDQLIFDPSNKNNLTVFRNDKIAKVTELSSTTIASMEKNGVIADVNAVATALAASATAKLKAAQDAQQAANEAVAAAAEAQEAAEAQAAKIAAKAAEPATAITESTPETSISTTGTDADDAFFDENADAEGADDSEPITGTTAEVQLHKMSKKSLISHAAGVFPDLKLDIKDGHAALVEQIKAAQAAALVAAKTPETESGTPPAQQ